MNRTRLAALGLGTILVVGSLAIPMTAFAATNSISVKPVTTTITPAGSTGSTFTVEVVADSGSPLAGAAAGLSFDNSRLKLTAVTKDATMVNDGVSWAGFPATPAMSTFLANANSSGQIPDIGWVFSDGGGGLYGGAVLTTTASPAVDAGIFSATFQIIATGNSAITPFATAGVGGLIDGTGYYASNNPPTTYGQALTGVGFNAAQVVNPTPTPTPSQNPTPTPTPTPVPASAPPGSGTANVQGTVDSGFLGISVPTGLTIPLVRNATNNINVSVTVYSNIIWNLQVSDGGQYGNPPAKTANIGFMTSSSNVLSNPMHVLQGPYPDPKYAGNTLYYYDANLASPTTPNTIASGSNSTIVVTTLAQFVAPQDRADTYSMNILYSAVSGF